MQENMRPSAVKKLNLSLSEDITGIKFNTKIFPLHLNLEKASKADLKVVFDAWPLEIGKVPKVYRYLN
jgi:hypothetical protein